MDIKQPIKAKKGTIIALGLIFLVVVGGVIILKLLSKPTQKAVDEKEDILPQVEIIPTVDQSVKISLIPNKAKNEVTLSITNFPKGTKTFEYSLSYEVADGTIQGTETTEPVKLGEEISYKKTILLGTESSGHRVYHEVVGGISVEIKFTGDYGQRIFQKEFPL